MQNRVVVGCRPKTKKKKGYRLCVVGVSLDSGCTCRRRLHNARRRWRLWIPFSQKLGQTRIMIALWQSDSDRTWAASHYANATQVFVTLRDMQFENNATALVMDCSCANKKSQFWVNLLHREKKNAMIRCSQNKPVNNIKSLTYPNDCPLFFWSIFGSCCFWFFGFYLTYFARPRCTRWLLLSQFWHPSTTTTTT